MICDFCIHSGNEYFYSSIPFNSINLFLAIYFKISNTFSPRCLSEKENLFFFFFLECSVISQLAQRWELSISCGLF